MRLSEYLKGVSVIAYEVSIIHEGKQIFLGESVAEVQYNLSETGRSGSVRFGNITLDLSIEVKSHTDTFAVVEMGNAGIVIRPRVRFPVGKIKTQPMGEWLRIWSNELPLPATRELEEILKQNE